MKYIIFSDVHGNLEAIESFCRVIESIGHDKKVCLGDNVGYNADPNFAVEWIREEVDLVLAGNHDYAVLKKTDTRYFNPIAYQACVWTRNVLTKTNKEYLDTLSVAKDEDDIYWVHSSPFEPTEWHYVTERLGAEENFDSFKQTLCFIGHSHLPGILEKNESGEIRSCVASRMELSPKSRYIINVGSLGQPRDGNPEPTFVFYDSASHVVEFHRFPYDLSSTQEKIRACGLPSHLADRLENGR